MNQEDSIISNLASKYDYNLESLSEDSKLSPFEHMSSTEDIGNIIKSNQIQNKIKRYNAVDNIFVDFLGNNYNNNFFNFLIDNVQNITDIIVKSEGENPHFPYFLRKGEEKTFRILENFDRKDNFIEEASKICKPNLVILMVDKKCNNKNLIKKINSIMKIHDVNIIITNTLDKENKDKKISEFSNTKIKTKYVSLKYKTIDKLFESLNNFIYY